MYSLFGCKFLTVTFDSTTGNFEEYFSLNDVPDELRTYQASIGLFTWSRPISTSSYDPNSSNDAGVCVGYQETMLEALSNQNVFFDLARIFGILAILLSIFMVSWSFCTACVLWNRVQLFLFSSLNFISVISSGLTFLIYRSNLCNNDVGNTSVFLKRNCTIDNGAFIMIGSCIMWFTSFLISVVYLKPTEEFRTKSPSIKRTTRSTLAENEGLQRSLARKATIKQDTSSASSTIKHSNNRTLDLSSTSPETILKRNSYSFDSQTDWNRPIPSRSVLSSKQQQQQNALDSIEEGRQTLPFRSKEQQATPSTHQQTQALAVSMKRKPSVMVVDDISDPDTMEVYIKQRLDRIDNITSSEF